MAKKLALSATLRVTAQQLVVDGETSYSPGVLVCGPEGSVLYAGPVGTAPLTSPETRSIDCELLTPGFVDIHNHGCGGTDDVQGFWTNPKHTLREAMTPLFFYGCRDVL